MEKLIQRLLITIGVVLFSTVIVVDVLYGNMLGRAPVQAFLGDCVIAAAIIISTCIALIVWIKIKEIK